MALLSLRNVSLAFGGPKLLDQVDLQIEPGERVCLLGRNGEGKSTLLRLIRGEIQPDEGQVIRQQGLRVSLLPQDVPRHREGQVDDQVAEGLDDGEHPATGSDHRVQAIISRMGLDPAARFEDLSSGMKRRVLLAQALVSEPDILLLDEPTNHLDIDVDSPGSKGFSRVPAATLVFVTHDRVFLEKLATRIVELDRGHINDWACDYPTFLQRREDVLAAEARQNALFDKKLAQEEVWIRKGIQARRTRNEGRVRALKALRDARKQRRERQGTAKIQSSEGERSGTLVIEAKGVSFGYEDRPVIQRLTTTILRGDKVGIIGPNAAGKTTLIRLLLGDLPARAGDHPPGRAARDRLLRPVESDARRGKDGHSEHQRLRHDPDQRPAAAHPELPPGFPVRARTVAHAGQVPLGRRAEPFAPGQALHQAVEPAGPRRAHQRPRRRDARALGITLGRVSRGQCSWSATTGRS